MVRCRLATANEGLSMALRVYGRSDALAMPRRVGRAAFTGQGSVPDVGIRRAANGWFFPSNSKGTSVAVSAGEAVMRRIVHPKGTSYYEARSRPNNMPPTKMTVTPGEVFDGGFQE